MRIPDKIKIGAYDYEIKMVDDLHKTNGNGNPATITSKHQIIWIDTTQHIQEQESSLIHEILEAIDYHYAIKLDHDKLSVLETALYQVFKDNGMFRD